MDVSRSLTIDLQKILEFFLHPPRILDLNFPQLEILLLELLVLLFELCELFLELVDPVHLIFFEMVVLFFVDPFFELAVLLCELVDQVLELSGWSIL